MVTLTVSQQQYHESVAQQNLSRADRVSTLLAQNTHLDGHRWTDGQLRAIPSDLLRYAYEHSLALRTEFITYDTFAAYWRQLQKTRTR